MKRAFAHLIVLSILLFPFFSQASSCVDEIYEDVNAPNNLVEIGNRQIPIRFVESIGDCEGALVVYPSILENALTIINEEIKFSSKNIQQQSNITNLKEICIQSCSYPPALTFWTGSNSFTWWGDFEKREKTQTELSLHLCAYHPFLDVSNQGYWGSEDEDLFNTLVKLQGDRIRSILREDPFLKRFDVVEYKAQKNRRRYH